MRLHSGIKPCSLCKSNRASIRRPRNNECICRECFYSSFEEEIHRTIVDNNLFRKGEKVVICVSGGKDSTVLAHVIKLLNDRHNYGVELSLLSIDEGIEGYRDKSLEVVESNQRDYNIPLKTLTYQNQYNWSMDEVVKVSGKKNSCTFCGVFRRQLMDIGATSLGANTILTGHNADDIAETVFLNLLRGDIARLGRCTLIKVLDHKESNVIRSKPFKYTYEKDIVLYAHLKKLKYFSTECNHYAESSRSYIRTFMKDLELANPGTILNTIKACESFVIEEHTKLPQQKRCTSCNYMSSNDICKACLLLQGLNNGSPMFGICRSSRSHI